VCDHIVIIGTQTQWDEKASVRGAKTMMYTKMSRFCSDTGSMDL